MSWEKAMIARIAGTMFFAAVVIALFLIGAIVAHAQSPEARRQFFEDVKRAQFFDGRRFNCCGPGDATKAKIISSGQGMLAVQIVDPMRHPTAKAGEVYAVPRKLIVRKPMAPEGMGTILFLSIAGKQSQRTPFCLVQKRAGG
jgi:hypothetical protein